MAHAHTHTHTHTYTHLHTHTHTHTHTHVSIIEYYPQIASRGYKRARYEKRGDTDLYLYKYINIYIYISGGFKSSRRSMRARRGPEVSCDESNMKSSAVGYQTGIPVMNEPRELAFINGNEIYGETRARVGAN